MPAKTKKVVPYHPATKFPSTAANMHRLLKADGYKLGDIIRLINESNAARGGNYWSGLLRKWESGEITEATIGQFYNDRMVDRVAQHVFPFTPTYQRINDAFLAEYDSRADLQEVYTLAVNGRGWAYTVSGDCVDLNNHPQYKTRPESFLMYSSMISRCTESRKKIELSRSTPYQEGDLVLLRKEGMDRRGVDPLYIPRWGYGAQPGKSTPDETVERIGTVISVTEKVGGYHAVKGSKLIKVLWMGVEDGSIHDIPEKYLKWRERPTYKNGLKVRE